MPRLPRGIHLVWLRQSHEVPDRPRDHVSITVQPARRPCPRADHLRNITRNRRLLGDNNHGHGLAPKERIGNLISAGWTASGVMASFWFADWLMGRSHAWICSSVTCCRAGQKGRWPPYGTW